MNTFRLRIYTIESPFYDGDCESLIVPTEDGAYGIMARHCDVVIALASGELKYRIDEKDYHVAVAPGIVNMKDNVVTVLTETAEYAEEIDLPRAEKQYQSAKDKLKIGLSPVERHMAQAQLSRALTRLKVRSDQNGK